MNRTLQALSIFFFFALVYSAQVLPRLSADSLTNDEPVEITNGYYFWTQGDIITPHLHPPLSSALNALPLLFLHLKTDVYSGDVFDRAHAFLFEWNLYQLPSITVLSRSVTWFFGLLTGFALYWITRKEPLWCAGTLFFWSLNPTFLALAGLSKIEIIPDLFFLSAVFIFSKAMVQEKAIPWGWSGLFMALAVACKYDMLVLIPIFGLLIWFSPDRPKRRPWPVLLGFLVGTLLAYLPFLVLSPERTGFFAILWEKISENAVFAHHAYPVYWLGQADLSNHWAYFPFAFVIKEPLPFVMILVWVLIGSALGKIRVPLWQWLPVLVLGIALLFVTNLGVRYLLPLYPFLFLAAGRGFVEVWKKDRVFLKVAVSLLLLWQAASLAVNFPHHLSYFNELVPPEGKMHYLADSNLDWGQDTIRLAEAARELHWGKVKLALGAGVDPAVYGLDWEPFRAEDLSRPQPGWVYVIDATFYQLAPVACPPTRPIVESWIRTRLPTGMIGDSWYFFEIPGKREKEKPGEWLPSAPFYQYRGYAYPLKRSS